MIDSAKRYLYRDSLMRDFLGLGLKALWSWRLWDLALGLEEGVWALVIGISRRKGKRDKASTGNPDSLVS